MCALIPKSHSLFFFLFFNKCNTQCHKVPRKVFTQKQAGRQRHTHTYTHTSKLPVLYLSACQQDVTVPAFSSKFLSQTALFFSPVQFSLIVLSALFSLPPWLSLPPFFLLPLSFVPSPTTLYHLSPDSLSVSHGTASIWDTQSRKHCPIIGAGLHRELLCSAFQDQRHYGAVNQGIVQEEMLVY